MTRVGLAAPQHSGLFLRKIFFFFEFLPNIKKHKPILTLQPGRYAKDFTGGIWITRKVFTEVHFFMCVFSRLTLLGQYFCITFFFSFFFLLFLLL